MTMPRQFTLIIDYVPGQGWEAAFEGGFPTLNTGGLGWEADTPEELLTSVAPALRQFHQLDCEDCGLLLPAGSDAAKCENCGGELIGTEDPKAMTTSRERRPRAEYAGGQGSGHAQATRDQQSGWHGGA